MFQPDTKGRVGAVLNMIFAFTLIVASFTLIFAALWAIIFAIIFLAFGIWAMIANFNFFRYYRQQKAAGILGIIFCGIIGGILVLVASKESLDARRY